MNTIDDVCAECFFREQLKLFPKPVADNLEEALVFLEDCMASVFDSKEELETYMKEEGIDCDGEDISEMLEVFLLPDGRYLYVEA